MRNHEPSSPGDSRDYLDEMIGAVRAAGPSDAESDAAVARLRARLASAAPPVAARPRARVMQVIRASVTLAAAAIVVAALSLPFLAVFLGTNSARALALAGAGELRILGADGQVVGLCPLRHTHVDANISGFVARAVVQQEFTNTARTAVEAVYVFPLPHDAAVDSMVIETEGRRTVGLMRERGEARAIYQAARAAGHVTGLLDQERPNIFMQSVANIAPGATVKVEIGFVQMLPFTDGEFEWVFPMTVAPRYNPQTTGTADALLGAPVQAAIPERRPGHNVSMDIFLNAGTPVTGLRSVGHEVNIDNIEAGAAMISLKDANEIPNRDFVLRYRPAEKGVADAVLAASEAEGHFLTLAIVPPERVGPAEARPREMIFVIDCSGSMNGVPLCQAKIAAKRCIEMMNPGDSFNLVTFSGGLGRCFEKPMENNGANRAAAFQFLDQLQSQGGTEMLPAVTAALGGPFDSMRTRIVAFMTDGQVGNDLEVIQAVRQNAAQTRVFPFGLGSAPNGFLLDGMARAGRGESIMIAHDTDCEVAATRFQERVQTPVLTDIAVDWGGLAVEEAHPALIPDLFSLRPIMVHAKLKAAASGEVTIRGNTAHGPFERRVQVSSVSADQSGRTALPALWARAKVDSLMAEADLIRAEQHNAGLFPQEIRDAITTVGTAYGIMTQFTSFVAVDEEIATTEPATLMRVPGAAPVGTDDYFMAQDGVDKAHGAFRHVTFRRVAGDTISEGVELGRPAIKPVEARVVSRDIDADGDADLVAAAGAQSAGSHQSYYNWSYSDMRSLATGIEAYYVDNEAAVLGSSWYTINNLDPTQLGEAVVDAEKPAAEAVNERHGAAAQTAEFGVPKGAYKDEAAKAVSSRLDDSDIKPVRAYAQSGLLATTTALFADTRTTADLLLEVWVMLTTGTEATTSVLDELRAGGVQQLSLVADDTTGTDAANQLGLSHAGRAGAPVIVHGWVPASRRREVEALAITARVVEVRRPAAAGSGA